MKTDHLRTEHQSFFSGYKYMSFRGPTNPYTLPQVILAPVLDEIQANDSNLEPPMVRIRSPNSAILSLDSSADSTGSSGNFIVGGGDQPPIATRRIKRIAMTSLHSALNTPNINDRNNTLVFRASTTNWLVDHTASVRTGYYFDVPTALNALLVALTNCSPPSGLAFSFLPYDPASLASDPFRRRLQTVAGTFFTFSSLSGMGRYGRYLYGIPYLTPVGPIASWPAQFASQASNNLPFGQILLQSTRWIDVVSTTLTSYTKNPSFGNNLGNESILARLFLPPPTGSPILSYIIDHPVWTNYERGRQLGNVDVQLLDEFGLPLFKDPLGKTSVADPEIAMEWENDYTILDLSHEI